jgi:hypothetical protein
MDLLHGPSLGLWARFKIVYCMPHGSAQQTALVFFMGINGEEEVLDGHRKPSESSRMVRMRIGTMMVHSPHLNPIDILASLF